MGIEPTTPRATTWCSNQLSYAHHLMNKTFLYARVDSPIGMASPEPLDPQLRRRLMLYPSDSKFVCTPEWTRTTDPQLRRLMLYPIELRALIIHKITKNYFLSGRQDSNLRPPAPKAGAITGLRYAP